MKKILAIMLALAMCLALVACGDETTTPTGTEPQGTTGGEVSTANSLSVCLASEPDTLDPALNSAVDGATMVSHLFSGLA